MTLAQYMRILRHQWHVVLILTALCVAGAAGFTARQTPIYAATTKMFVSVNTSGADITDLSQGGTFTQQRVKSYADVVTSQGVLNEVIEQLDLHTTAAKLAKKISVDAPLNTVVLDVTVNDPSAQRAADIANAIAGDFPTFVKNLETPAGQDKSSVKISVTDRAVLSPNPVSPRTPLNLVLGLLVGLVLGVGAAVLRDQLNTSVSTITDIETLTGSVPLGIVPFDASTPKQPLVDGDSKSLRAEAFRTLRTNLQFADVDHPPQVIVVTSALPGEGKSTTACNIAITLAQSGSAVILVDGDLRAPTVGTYFGISSSAGLSTVLAGRHELREVIVPSRGMSLALLPSGPTPPNPSELLGSQHMVDLIATLAKHYDAVVIDAPPLLPVTDGAILTAEADGAVMVIRHGKTPREAVTRAKQALEAVNGRLLGTVLNFAPKRMDPGAYAGYRYGYGATSKPQPIDPNDDDPFAGLPVAGKRSVNGRSRAQEAPVEPGSHSVNEGLPRG